MKRLASLFLALILACSLMACGAKDDSTKDDPDTSEKTYKIALVMPTMRNDQFCISAYNGFWRRQRSTTVRLRRSSASAKRMPTTRSRCVPALRRAWTC